MLDPKFIRENPDKVKEALKKRNDSFDLDSFLRLDNRRKDLLSEIENRRAGQNKIDGEMKILLKDKKDPQPVIEKAKQIKKEISLLEEEYRRFDEEFKKQLLRIPNIVHESLPVGDASNNKIVRIVEKPVSFKFKPKDHIQLAENLEIIDFKRAAKLSGSNFILFKGEGARLQRALINFMLDLHTGEHGYKEVSVPVMVNRTSMTTTGQLPKLEEDMYLCGQDDLFLIPTAEVPITNIHREEVINEDDLPVYYVGYTPCFRREAGSYGKETRGLMRVHQFDKVEMVKFVKPADSYDELEKLLLNACKVLDLLNLSYRIVLLAGGDISFAAAKCYDIELYAPGIDKWLEVSSCSNFEDFQARRGNIRYKDKETGKNYFVHTLNGSGVALPRLLIALLETYQQPDGSILIPPILRKYYGREKLTK